MAPRPNESCDGNCYQAVARKHDVVRDKRSARRQVSVTSDGLPHGATNQKEHDGQSQGTPRPTNPWSISLEPDLTCDESSDCYEHKSILPKTAEESKEVPD